MFAHVWVVSKALISHQLKYRPLEAMRPSFLTSKPSSTYTLIGSWYMLMSKTFLIGFFKLIFLENYVMLRGLWQALSLLACCFMCSFFFLLLAWSTCGRGHHYWIISRHETWWPPKRSFSCFGPLLNSFKNHCVGP